MKLFSFDNFVCKLGGTARENWKLLDEAKDTDIFLHLSAFPSGYVIMEYEEELDNAMLVIAAQICKQGTKYRNLYNVKVDYCYCNNLRKGEKTGVVYYQSKNKVKQIKI